MNPIFLNFMTKFLTCKTFILDLRQILDLRSFVNPTPGFVVVGEPYLLVMFE